MPSSFQFTSARDFTPAQQSNAPLLTKFPNKDLIKFAVVRAFSMRKEVLRPDDF